MASVLTSHGARWIRDSLTGGTAPATGDYIGWGTGAGTAAITDTSLFSEASTGISMGGETRILATRTISGLNVVQWVGTLTAASAKTITNAGNFNYALSSGSAAANHQVLTHGDFTGVALNADDQIQFTINLLIS